MSTHAHEDALEELRQLPRLRFWQKLYWQRLERYLSIFCFGVVYKPYEFKCQIRDIYSSPEASSVDDWKWLANVMLKQCEMMLLRDEKVAG